MAGAENQQERPSQRPATVPIEAVPIARGYFLSGFALGEASFMIVCRRRGDYITKWKISAAFNVSQNDRAPLELFMETLGCGSIRKAGNNGWYWEVNRLSDIQSIVVPFFDRFSLVGTKARDFRSFKRAVEILSLGKLDESGLVAVLDLREQMNNGGKKKYTREGSHRDYTPGSASFLT